jgi:hypothetical protein
MKIAPKATSSFHARDSEKPTTRRRWHDLETVEKMLTEQRFRANTIKEQGLELPCGDPKRILMARLWRKLKRCRRDGHCHSPACPVCMRSERSFWINSMVAHLGGMVKDIASLSAVTLVHEDWEIPAGKLHTFKPRVLLDRVRKQLHRAKFRGAAIGKIDFDFVPDRMTWGIHLHFVAAGLTPKVEDRLREYYEPSESVGTPMMVKEVDDLAGAVSYALKSFPKYRVRFRDAQGRMNTPSKRRRVPEPYHTEYLLAVDQFPPSALMLVIGVKRYGDGLREV